MVHFFDGNKGGVIYVGTEADMAAMDNNGGCSFLWNGDAAPVGETIEVKIEGTSSGTINVEHWPVEKATWIGS